jgi:hypothetical protein
VVEKRSGAFAAPIVESARSSGADGPDRTMTPRDVDQVVAASPRSPFAASMSSAAAFNVRIAPALL